MSLRPQPAITVVLLVVASAVLVAHSLLFDFITDDAFISFVYARNLVRHGELVFNLGERVEGYTNFLWTMLIALGLHLGVPAEISCRVLGVLFGGLTLWACAAASRQLRDPNGPYAPDDALPALLLCGMPGYACWSSGGLETQLFTMLCSLGAFTYLREQDHNRSPLASATLFGLAALTRPEGYLFFGLTVLHRAGGRVLGATRGGGWRALLPSRAEWRWGALFLLLTVPHLAFRRWYYGDWVPNTFYIKSSSIGGAWQQGGYYLLLFCREQKVWLLPPLATGGLLVAGPRRRQLAAALGYMTLLSVVFLIYVAAVGGDFMGLHRFVLPIVPGWAVLGAVGLLRVLRAAVRPLWARGLVLIALLVLYGVNTWQVDRRALSFVGADHGIDTPAYLRHFAADRAAIGRWLGQHAQPDDYQVVGGAGAQVYYAGIRALDSFGLCDAYVARHVPPTSVRPGHQKFAPLSYVLSRKPTIITYNVYRIGDEPYRPSPEEARMWREHGFHFVSVQIPGLSRPWYSFLKRVDRRLGPLPPADEMDP
ncbi:MAG: hypothetical protein RMK29_00520 [Myxococcales bacterium]|nr:hypothetical protein [Myxococcales bacterium]